MQDLRERAAELPLSPGVYLYKDAYDTVIYVGKAKNLRARVRSYFSDERLASEEARAQIHAIGQQQQGCEQAGRTEKHKFLQHLNVCGGAKSARQASCDSGHLRSSRSTPATARVLDSANGSTLM